MKTDQISVVVWAQQCVRGGHLVTNADELERDEDGYPVSADYQEYRGTAEELAKVARDLMHPGIGHVPNGWAVRVARVLREAAEEHGWCPPTNEYEIGGVCVLMTADHAERWNRGNWSAGDDDEAVVCLPDEYEQPSRNAGGIVELGSPRLVRAARRVPMSEAIEAEPAIGEQMHGRSANLIRADVQ